MLLLPTDPALRTAMALTDIATDNLWHVHTCQLKHPYKTRSAMCSLPYRPFFLSASSHCRLLEALEAFHAGKKQNGRPSFTSLSPDSRSRTLGASPTSVASRAPKLTYDDGAVPLRMCTLNRGSRLLRSRTSYWFPSSWPLHCFAGVDMSSWFHFPSNIDISF